MKMLVILTKLSSLAAMEVVKMTTSSAAIDENFVNMTTFSCQWMLDITWQKKMLSFGGGSDDTPMGPPAVHRVNPWRRSQAQLNSSPPSAAYMRQWIGSALIQIMAWRIFGAKPLSKPMLGYCQLGP